MIELTHLSTEELKAKEVAIAGLVAEYPYFALGHILNAKLNFDKSVKNADILAKAALYSLNRSLLFEYLYREEFFAKPIQPVEKVEQLIETPVAIAEEVAVIEKEETPEDTAAVKDKAQIIEKFLKTNPSVSQPTDQDYSKTTKFANESLKENLDFVSETLAEIYLKQGNKEKAIKIFQQLSLKYPEKKLYFAAQIKKIE